MKILADWFCGFAIEFINPLEASFEENLPI